jgi:hypothetical protein
MTLVDVKILKNRLLRQTDYIMLVDNYEELTVNQKTDIKNYRQELKILDDVFKDHGTFDIPVRPSRFKPDIG